MKISEIPKDQRPREKLLNKGSNYLSNEELLAIFLRIGMKNKNAIDLAKELLTTFGGLRGLYNADINSLLKIAGLGKAKIAQLLAVIELNKRYLEENIKDRKIIEDSKSIFDYLYLTMRDLDFELFKVIYLNGQNQILNIEDIFKGTITHSHIYTREIIKGALRNSATSIVCVHNHPSGDSTPSDADVEITKKIKDSCESIGIVFQDHIIIGDNQYFSFKDKELV
jgi:DNA repair protein RadC